MFAPAGLAEIVPQRPAVGVEAVRGRRRLEIVARVDAQDQRIGRIVGQDVVDDPVPVVEQVGGGDAVVDADPRPRRGIPVQQPLQPGAERRFIGDLHRLGEGVADERDAIGVIGRHGLGAGAISRGIGAELGAELGPVHRVRRARPPLLPHLGLARADQQAVGMDPVPGVPEQPEGDLGDQEARREDHQVDQDEEGRSLAPGTVSARPARELPVRNRGRRRAVEPATVMARPPKSA